MAGEDDVREIRRELERVRDQIDDIKNIQALQVRAMGDIRELVLDYFSGRGGENKAKIYLAANGERSVTEIADKVGVSKGYVTRKCKEMHDLGLLGWEPHGNSKLYHPTVIERALHLSNDLKSDVLDS